MFYNKRFTDNDSGFTVWLELYSDKSGSIKIYTGITNYTEKIGYIFCDNEATLFSFSNFEEFIENFIDWAFQNVGV